MIRDANATRNGIFIKTRAYCKIKTKKIINSMKKKKHTNFDFLNHPNAL
jgi:hypothetical protein